MFPFQLEMHAKTLTSLKATRIRHRAGAGTLSRKDLDDAVATC
jgi:hypothetical protein